MARQKHILVIRFSAMGDVAMTVPVIRALTNQNPQLKITILTKAFFTPIYNSIPGVSVLAADLKGRHKGFKGLYTLSKEIKELRIDGVADLHNVLRTNILKLFLTSLPFYQIDKGRADKKALTTGHVFKQLKSTHERYVDVFGGLGININLKNPIFPEKHPLPHYLNKIAVNKKLVGIAPFAAHSAKMYPLDLMEGVIKKLSSKYTVILFGGGQDEEKALTRIEHQQKNTISVAGKLTFEEELNLISNLDLMISMDSGNGHLAAIYGVTVLTIWGVTHPFAGFTPFNQPIHNSLLADRGMYPKIPTSIYGNKYPKGYERAAGSIASDAIIGKAENLLEA